MRTLRVVLTAGLMAGLLLFAMNAGRSIHFVPSETHAGESEGQTLYTCPMHPQIIRDHPGQCPVCGMDLVPKKASSDEKPVGKEKKTILVDPATVQNMAVRVAKAERGIVHRHVRTFGRVEVPDDARWVVNMRFSGWVEQIQVDEVGASVKKGDRLFSIYSPDVFSAEREYVLALKSYGPGHEISRSAETRLRLWGIDEQQIDKIRTRMKPARLVIIRAPASGFVERVNVVEGSRVAAGKDLYTIVDLTRVWLLAEVYDLDAPWIKKGAQMDIRFSVPRLRRYTAPVSYIYPTLNPRTLTLTVRAELPNPDMALRPGMIARLFIDAHRDGERLIIPSEAIINTGDQKFVFVARALGKYQMQKVETGLVGDDGMTEVVSGLVEGQNVVTSGQFLLDSESQLQEAAQKFLEQQLQTVGDQGVPASKKHDDGVKKILYTCPMHPQIIRDHPGQCPICGMDLVRKK